MNWYLEALRKYAVFQGRARRKEFWFFQLFFALGVFTLAVVDVMLGFMDKETGTGLLSTLFWLAMFLPGLAVSVHRLHDTDRTGWWVLIGLIPLVGIIVLLIFYVHEGTRGSNRFGKDPKEAPPTGIATAISEG